MSILFFCDAFLMNCLHNTPIPLKNIDFILNMVIVKLFVRDAGMQRFPSVGQCCAIFSGHADLKNRELS